MSAAQPEVGPGVILVDKPAGVTSHDVVARVRRTLPRATKVGHAGTLDPFATGLLLVLVGRATRAQRYLLGLPKTYHAVARLGWRSDTGDRDGALERTGRMPAALTVPIGELMQRPPAYSAVRVGGERLYERARRGDPVEGEPRPVTVHRAALLWHDGERAAFELEVSSGTYVRQLVSALDDAYCEALQRTAVGCFDLADADPERIVPVSEALAFLPERTLDADEARAVGHGRRVARRIDTACGGRSVGEEPAAAVRLTHAGALVALAEPRGHELAPVVVFAR